MYIITRARREPIGQMAKWIFIAFNAVMLFWMIGTLGAAGGASSAAATGATWFDAAIHATLALDEIFLFWTFGTVVLGVPAILTRGRLVLAEESPPVHVDPTTGVRVAPLPPMPHYHLTSGIEEALDLEPALPPRRSHQSVSEHAYMRPPLSSVTISSR